MEMARHKRQKTRKKERKTKFLVHLYYYSLLIFLFFQHGSERINRDGNQERNTKHRIPTQAPVWRYAKFFLALLLCIRRFGVRSRFLAQCYLLPPTKRSRPFRIRPVVTRGCTPDDINTHRAQHRWRFTWKVKRPGIKRNNQKFKGGRLQYTRALEGK
jgi:hypothetical protein